MTNSNTEEKISKKYFDEWNNITGFVEPNTGYYFEILSVIEEAIQEHTAQNIDRLKEKVQGLEKESKLLQSIWQDEFNKGFNSGCRIILQLIDE